MHPAFLTIDRYALVRKIAFRGIPRNLAASDFTQPLPRGICAIPRNDDSRKTGGGG